MMMEPHFSPLFRSQDLVFVSGQMAFVGGAISGHITQQTDQVIRRIAAILQGGGLTLKSIIKTTVWIRHASDFPAFNAAYAAAFGDHMPARSTVVAELVIPEALVEIEAVARAGASGLPRE